MKRTLNTLAAIAIVGSAVVSSVAHAEETRPKMEGGTTGMSAPAPKDESAYWAEKKLEQQRKSTEMRKQKVEELRAKGVDVSGITADLLDASKTEENLFWEAMKKVMQNKESVRTPNVKTKKEEMKPEMKHENKMEMKHENKMEMKHESGKSEMQKPAQKPVLTEKMRQTLVKRFTAIPDEKKAAYYEKTKANLEKQLENAKAKKNARLARKITETLVILDYVLGSQMDDAEEDEIINSATAE